MEQFGEGQQSKTGKKGKKTVFDLLKDFSGKNGLLQ